MKVSLVGAGPGDPGLLTVRAREILQTASVIVYDALANPQLLALARPDAELLYVGKIADKHALPQAEINALLVAKAREKGDVARLKGGDPYIFGRGGEEGEYIAKHGIALEVAPGISSAIAAPAYAGIPLTHRDLASSVIFITGHEKPDKHQSSHDWQAFVKSKSTLVFLMGMKNLAAICQNLIAAGMDKKMPGAVIYRGTTPLQRTVIAPVAELPDVAARAGLSNPAVIVIGRVVEMAGQLDWFGQKPLLGKRIVITRSREQASALTDRLAELGAAVTEFPTIAIQPLEDYSACDQAISDLPAWRWLVFTSVNGVRMFWRRLAKAGLDTRALCACKVAAIGPATADCLAAYGVKADLVPPTYIAESVAQALIQAEGGNLARMRILLPRAAEAREILPELLQKAGAEVAVAPVYRTVPGHGNVPELERLLASQAIDCIAFASSSTVRNFLKLVPATALLGQRKLKLAAIGPITAAELAKNGLTAAIQPQAYTIPSLVDAIAAALTGEEQ
ncbi:MAG: uroporphyrinogen-III C-methyltransferase [Desulfovibrio sp.]|nr:uroporphyrinogen-III C-methyltransferase [Desulfovibrio sp.]